MAQISSVCVYCGSRLGTSARHRETARTLGRVLAEAGIRIVYGGGRVGLMGLTADAALAAGGEVIGVIPGHLHDWEVGHHGTDLRIVGSMHERKNLMFELSDAFVVLPGGIGSLDETFEIVTWKQLRLHDKPILLLNDAGYWDPFLRLIDHIIANGFAAPDITRLFEVVERVEDVVPRLRAATPPRIADRSDRL